MEWFYNLPSKVKLCILSTTLIVMNILICMLCIYSNYESILMSREIEYTLNTSAKKINDLQTTLRAFDANTLAYLSSVDNSGEPISKEMVQSFDRDLMSIKDSVSKLNPNMIGSMPASEEYRNAVKQLMVLCQNLESNFSRNVEVTMNDHTIDSLRAYVNTVRPEIHHTLDQFLVVVNLQNEQIIYLSELGADLSPVYISIVVTIVSFVVGLFLSLLINGYINKCIRRQRNFIEAMRNGDFSFEIQSYNKDDFGEMIDLIRITRDTINHALGMVKQNTTRTATSLHEVASIASNVCSHLNECDTKAISVSAASEEMLATTKDIAKNCDEASGNSNTTEQIISSGVEKIEHTIADIRRQSGDLNNNSVAVEKVAKRSLDISSIVSTIDEIAAQTNLLALNAAIEAARAGEAGRGFAVVADEVRALASRTAASTKEIAAMVSDIQRDAAIATESISNSVTAMEATSQNSSEVESIMHEMLTHVNTVNMQITQIASAAEEQSAASNEIASNIQSVTNLTQTCADYANRAESILEQTVDSLDELQNSLSFFKTKELEQ